MIHLECIEFLDFRIPSTIWIKTKKVLFIIMYLLEILILITIADYRVYFCYLDHRNLYVLYHIIHIHMCTYVRIRMYICVIRSLEATRGFFVHPDTCNSMWETTDKRSPRGEGN